MKVHRKMNYFYEFFQKLIHIAISRIFLHELEIEYEKDCKDSKEEKLSTSSRDLENTQNIW